MAVPPRIAVLASGRGSNLAALIGARERGELPVEFVLVASDKADAGALRLAEAAGIPTLALSPKTYPDRRAYDLDLFARVAASGADWLVLAGFMRVIDAGALRPWVGRVINIHPSLLPKYRGLHTHRRALEAGDTEHGASVHFVTAELDHGPIVIQAVVPVKPADTAADLAARVLRCEHVIYPRAVRWFVENRLRVCDGRVDLVQGRADADVQWLMGGDA